MKSIFVGTLAVLSLISGCARQQSDRQDTAQPSPIPPASSPAEKGKDGWNPDLIPGGSMFPDAASFLSYVDRASVIGKGVLKQWDGQRGTVQVETLYRGKAAAQQLPVTSTGGVMEATVNDPVFFLLAERDGELKLHSFCAASGLFPVSQPLRAAIEQLAGSDDGRRVPAHRN